MFQMEDDVEVELELEKQLSLAHELFWQRKEMEDGDEVPVSSKVTFWREKNMEKLMIPT